MRKIFFLFLLFTINSIKPLVAQTGSLIIEGDQQTGITIHSDIKLYTLTDELVYKKSIVVDDIRIRIDSLAIGLYNLKVFKEGALSSIYYNVKISTDTITEFHCASLDHEPDQYPIKKYDNKKGPTIALFLQTFQSPLSSQKENVQSTYAIGIRVTPLHYLSKNYGIGAHIASSLGINNLEKGKFTGFTDVFSRERYTYWKLSVAFVNRIVFKQASKTKVDLPWFLDVGIGYNLPIMYRYVGIKDDKKEINRYVSNYNDFSAIARLGFGVLSFTAEYRFTNNIKTIYPSVPQLMLGIDIILPTN
jgi:hypothetical protein